MKKSVSCAIVAASVAVLALASYALAPGKENVITLSGSISDSQCAFNVHSDSHSHKWMEKQGVYGVKDDKSCTLRCVKEMGGRYVLVTQKTVYHLDDQTRPEKFAGSKVKVTGTLDAKTQTVHVVTMEAEK
jgi:type 1 fimbria pilin